MGSGNGKKYFSVASGGGTGRTLHPDNMAAGPASYGLTDSMGRMHGDAQFAGSSSVPAHVEMMGLMGMGNNPMVGATVACAVAVYEGLKKIRNRRAFLAIDPVLSSKASVKARTPCFFELFGGLAGPPHTKEISPDERGGLEHESGAVDDAAEMFQRPVQQTKSRFLA